MSTATSTFELRLSCRNLSDLDLFSKSDPMVIVYMRYGINEPWIETGRTECIMNNLNPVFCKPIVLPWFFEANQYIRFLVIDVDSSNLSKLEDQDMIGFLETTLSDIISQNNNKSEYIPLIRHPKNKSSGNVGSIKISVEELQENKSEIYFQISLSDVHLERTCGFKNSFTPYLTILRMSENGELIVVYRSSKSGKKQHAKLSNIYNWPVENISLAALCNGHSGRQLTFRVENGSKLHGSGESSISDIKQGETKVKLFNNRKNSLKQMGTISFPKWENVPLHTFYDYLQGGHNISLSVGVDFTQSNGHPSDPTSLHYMNNNEQQNPNAYIRAMCAVGSILEQYDTKKVFPAFAFGCAAKFGNIELLSTLSLDPPNVFVHGVSGLIHAYGQAINRLKLFGPTFFAPLINITCNEIEKNQYNLRDTYYILLIITDGIINDMNQTKKAIIRACNLPLSVVIVGVGSQDFSQMEELDGDLQRITVDGQIASRDIVQFVAMRDFEGYSNHQARLSSEVLAEIPGQFTEYMKMKKIAPINFCA